MATKDNDLLKRVKPINIEAEKSLLSTMFLSSYARDRAFDTLGVDGFQGGQVGNTGHLQLVILLEFLHGLHRTVQIGTGALALVVAQLGQLLLQPEHSLGGVILLQILAGIASVVL